MDKTVIEILDALRAVGVVPVVTDLEIKVGRISLRVIPSVDSDSPDRLFLDFPEDLRPDEAALPMALKAAVIDCPLHDFLGRLKSSLTHGREHLEAFPRWQIRCSQKGALLSIEARSRASS